MRDFEDALTVGVFLSLIISVGISWALFSHTRRLQRQKDLIPVCQSLPSEQCEALVHNICM